jgi:hypothetical protein
MEDCKKELGALLGEDVSCSTRTLFLLSAGLSLILREGKQRENGSDQSLPLADASLPPFFFYCTQRLAGATLLIFANKQDVQTSMTVAEIKTVSFPFPSRR